MNKTWLKLFYDIKLYLIETETGAGSIGLFTFLSKHLDHADRYVDNSGRLTCSKSW